MALALFHGEYYFMGENGGEKIQKWMGWMMLGDSGWTIWCEPSEAH